MELKNINIISLDNSQPVVQYTNKHSKKLLSSQRYSLSPKGQWKNHSTQHAILPQNENIIFFKLQSKLSKELFSSNLDSINNMSKDDLLNIANNALFNIKNLDSVFKLRSVEIKLNPSRKNSTAFNLNTNEYMGLHIDSHDGIKNSNRRKAWKLININLGKSDRYFYFVDLNFQQLIKLIGIQNDERIKENTISMFEIVESLFSLYPSYPINRLVIPPNHGYIAKTQYIIHDGGTNWNGNVDISLLISGEFNFK